MNSFVKKSTILAVAVGLSLFSPFSFAGVAMPAQPKNGQQQPPLNPEDVKLLEDVEQQINGYVAALPPDEQKKFWADVDELTKVMSTMSEDELVKFMEDVFTEEAAQKPAAPEIPITTPAKEVVEEKPVLPVDKQQAAIQLIDTLLKHIGNFLRKAQTMVDLPAKVIAWTKEGKLKNWPSSLTWDVFKGYVDELNQKLNKLKDRDPKTNKYKYLDDFIKDEALYNNLSKIASTISKHEPLIEVSSFGIDKMTTQSRESARMVLMSLQEAYSVLGIPAGLDKIFEKYEPTAKKHKESEEITQKQALEASKRPTSRAPMTVGGTSRDRETRRDYDYKGDQGGRYTPNYDYYDKRSDRAEDSTDKKKSDGVTSAGGGKDDGKDAGKENKPGDKAPDKKEEKEQRAIENAVDSFEKALDAFLTAVENNKNLLDFADHMRKDEKVDLEIYNSFKAAKTAINDAKSQVARMKRRVTSEKVTPSQKKEFVTLIKQAHKEQKTWLDRIANGIESAKKALDSSVLRTPANGTLKKFAYFNQSQGTDELVKEANAMTDAAKKNERLKEINDIKPIDVTELSDSIRELHKAVTELQ